MTPQRVDITDRRYCPSAMGVAHDSLRGLLDAQRFTVGKWHRVQAPLADLLASPGGARDRQLLAGTRFNVLVRHQGHVFGFDEDEGLCGWLAETSLDADHLVTHRVESPGTHAYTKADIKSPEVAVLTCGARVRVTGDDGVFAETPFGHIPSAHLRPVAMPSPDPVAIARGFLGTPYLWGGNSRAGIDCSGLVQVSRRACGLACPADSDVQALMPGQHLAVTETQPGDLLFWRGHVAMVTAKGQMIHANAHHMAVVEEPIAPAMARILAAGSRFLHALRTCSPKGPAGHKARQGSQACGNGKQP